jgi:hypothetical protein
LVEGAGLSISEAAAAMRLPEPRVQRLLEEAADRRDLERYKLDRIPNDRVRALFEQRRHREPRFTIAELARRAGYHQINVERWLGYAPTSPTTKNGRTYPGRILTTIDVDKAGRLVRALGYAPHEIDGL